MEALSDYLSFWPKREGEANLCHPYPLAPPWLQFSYEHLYILSLSARPQFWMTLFETAKFRN